MSRQQVIDLDRRHVWRPYTAVRTQQQEEPLVIERAEGAYLIEADGRRFLDANGSWWANNLGHSHPRVVAALKAQAERLMHCSLGVITHAPAAELAAELVRFAPPGLGRVFFSDNGSTAVEVAIKMAYQYFRQNGAPERRRFVSLGGAFHGDTLGAMSVSGVDAFRQHFGDLLFEVWHTPKAGADEAWRDAIDALQQHLQHAGSDVAAVIVEPLVQGAGGMQIWPAALLRALADSTRAAGSLLIADEVFTGMGRTGMPWACMHAGITPDLLCTAKWLSGGALPFAATLATERLYQGFAGGSERALLHGHTFTGNPLGAAVALEVLRIYADEDLLTRAQTHGAKLRHFAASLQGQPGLQRPRSLGMIFAVDLGGGGYHAKDGWRVHQEALKRGVYLRPLGNVVYLVPPLVLTDTELETMLTAVAESLSVVRTARG
ncbi:MAG: adenosylmethionine--8-amino-7-oxononanoate transaminase [Polyangiales bacterium]